MVDLRRERAGGKKEPEVGKVDSICKGPVAG